MTQRQADATLLFITALWGTTFAVVHEAVAAYPPLALIALRFGLAFVLLVPALFRRLPWRLYGVGLGLGVFLAAGFVTQTAGLALTTPARAGFITGLSVVLVPIIDRLLGSAIHWTALVGVAFSVTGLAVLTFGCHLGWLGCSVFEAARPERADGDLLVVACAFAYAVHIVGISRWAGDLPSAPLNAVQIGVVAAGAAVVSAATEGGMAWPAPPVAGRIVYLAVVATVVTFTLMLKAQRHTTPTRAALIYTLEAVFAAVFSWVWLDEVPSASVLVGGALMLLGVLVVEGRKAGVSTA